MPEIKDVYVEFFGDPSDDKECYKRYSSTQPFQPCGNDAEVIHFVNVKEADRLRLSLKSMPQLLKESLLEVTAWMGIPEHRRQAVISENVSNIEFIVNKALKNE